MQPLGVIRNQLTMIELEPRFKQFIETNLKFIEGQLNDTVNVYSAEHLKVRICREKDGLLDIDISTLISPQTQDDWIMISGLRSYMLNNDDYLKVPVFNETCSFFQENYQNILALLNTRLNQVKKALKKRGEQRAEVMFGPLPKPW